MTLFNRVLVLAALLPSFAGAQGGLPGTSVVATVRLRGVARSTSGDTTTISYSVLVSPSSHDRLFGFTISLPSVTATVIAPGSEPDWVATNTYEGKQVAGWWSMHTIAPGDSTPTLVFKGVGIPTQALAWITGDSATKLPGNDSSTVAASAFLDNLSAITTAIGLVPAPSGIPAIVAMLRTQSDSSCTLHWITSTVLCATLHSEASSSDYAHVNGFSTSLDSARNAGSSVTDAAYYLLKTNASYALAKITSLPLTDSISADTATSIYTAHPAGGTPGYSYLWEWCTTNCGGGALRAPSGGSPPAVVPNTVGHGWSNVGYTTASICWTMSQSTLRNTVTDAKGAQAIAYYSVPVLQHVCGGP